MSKKTKVSLVSVNNDAVDITPLEINETSDIKSDEVKVEEPIPVVEEAKEEPDTEPTVIIKEEKIDPIPQVKEVGEPVVAHIPEIKEVEKPVPTVEEIKEKLDDKWYIKLNDNPLSDDKRRIYENRIEKCNISYIFDAVGIMLAGPFNTEREAILARKRLVGKGLKGVVEYDHFFK